MGYSYPHPVPWTGKDLKGDWWITIKIDGVRMLRDDTGHPVSRAGKPLYNLEGVPSDITDAEIFYGNWENSITHVRSSTTDVGPVDISHVYSLFPEVDKRIDLGVVSNPTAKQIEDVMKLVCNDGYEGLVIREVGGVGKLYKVKPHETYDVKVTGFTVGTGKFAGTLGALVTPMGKVGTGFTNEQRDELYERLCGLPATYGIDHKEEFTLYRESDQFTIEVDCWELTKGGKFRHPRFVRVREDKE